MRDSVVLLLILGAAVWLFRPNREVGRWTWGLALLITLLHVWGLEANFWSFLQHGTRY